MGTIDTEPSFFTVLWKQWMLVVGIVVVAAVTGFGVSLLQPTVYEAEASIQLIDPNTAQGLTDQMGLARSAARNVANQAELMESPTVARLASEMLGGSPTPTDVESSIAATPITGQDTIALGGSGSTSQDAVALVDAVFDAYSSISRASADDASAELLSGYDEQQAEVEAEIAELQTAILQEPDNRNLKIRQDNAVNELRVIDRNRTRVEDQAGMFGDGIRAYTPPTTPSSPSQPAPVRNSVIAAVLGLLVATGVAWVRGINIEHAKNSALPSA